jgi:hypothetical protein
MPEAVVDPRPPLKSGQRENPAVYPEILFFRTAHLKSIRVCFTASYWYQERCHSIRLMAPELLHVVSRLGEGL